MIPVLILPRTPPPNATPGAKPSPIRLHRRPQRFADEPPPIAPLVTPTETRTAEERAAAAPGPRFLNLPSQEDAVCGQRGRHDPHPSASTACRRHPHS